MKKLQEVLLESIVNEGFQQDMKKSKSQLPFVMKELGKKYGEV